MDKISNVVLKPLEKSMYLKPLTMHFTQNGRKRTWDLLEVHDSVAAILYNPKKETMIFVRQFRPPVYYGSVPPEDRKDEIDVRKYPPELGITLEVCAGIVDKDKPVLEIMKEEVLEECGYDVPLDKFERIASYRSGVGSLGSLQTAFYCEVTDEMKVNQGGGVDDEIIDVVEMTIPQVKEYVTGENIKSPPSFMFMIYWFLHNKVK